MNKKSKNMNPSLITEILSLSDRDLLEAYFQNRLLWNETGEILYFSKLCLIEEDILSRFKGRVIIKST